MARFRAALALALLLAAASFASCQSATVTATHITDATGQALKAGQWCFGTTCGPVNTGSLGSGLSVTAGTGTVSITSGAPSVTLLVVNSVVIPSGTFSWDSFSLQPGQTAFGSSSPLLSCGQGATYTDVYANISYSCIGTNAWRATATLAARPSGSYVGVGSPSFYCTAPCAYTRTDVPTLYVNASSPNASGNVWTATSFGGTSTASTGNPRGAFSLSGSYAVNDVVTYNGNTYINIVATAAVTASSGTPSVNLFDQTAVTANYLVNSSNGVLVSFTNYTASGFIDLQDPSTGTIATSWTTNNVVGAYGGVPEGVAYYSAPNVGAFIAGNGDPGSNGANNTTPPTTVQNPNGYRYMRFNIAPTGADIALAQTMVVRGNTLPSSYVAYGTTTSTTPAAVPTDTTHWSLVTTTSSTTSSGISGLTGKTFMVLGDSYSQAFNNIWQTLFASTTGMVLGVQKAESGRHLYEIFSDYVSSTGVLNETALAADLNSHSLIIVYLGTNDVLSGLFTGAVAPGAATDTPVVPLNIQGGTSPVPGTAFAYVGGAMDTLDRLAPTVPKIFIGVLHMDRLAGSTPVYYDYTTTNASTDLFNSILSTEAQARGHLFVDMAWLCGANKYNVQTYPSSGTPQPNFLRDGVHPTDTFGFPAVVQQIVNGVRRVFGV